MIHLVVVVFTSFIVYIAKPGSSLFSWHPTLMVIAFCLFMLEGVLVFSPHSSLISPRNRTARVTWHWVTLCAALAAATGGLAAIYYNKHINNKHHFTTWHGLVGLISCVYFAFQTVGGLAAKYPRLLLPNFKIIDVRLYHAVSGLAVIFLVNATLYLSMFSTWFSNNIQGSTWYACASAPILTTLLLVQQIVQSQIPRLKNRMDRHLRESI